MIDRMAGSRILGRSPVGAYLRASEWIWWRVPRSLRAPGLATAYGRIMHGLVRRMGDRRQYLGTYFLRNRPQLELIRRLANERAATGGARIAVLGCSVGAEPYSILWSIRSTDSAPTIRINAVDISSEVLEIAREGAYSAAVSDLVREPIFARMSADEIRALFDRDGDRLRVKPALRDVITWCVGDARDPQIVDALGRHDLVVANDFLCHMSQSEAERCLRNIARLVEPGGYLVVSGIDLDVRTRVATDLGWAPIRDHLEAIHEGDRSLRESWPWRYWGLEPLDKKRRDWQVRYASAFRLGVTT
jgi:chemotaxis protein methyltransferase CheR